MALINKSTPEQFFSKLFELRDTTHLLHLKTKSYSQHMALGGFYDTILGIADGIIEGYQGIYGLVKFDVKSFNTEDPISYLKDSYRWIESNRSMFKESWIQNEIDTVQASIASTIYKLVNLK